MEKKYFESYDVEFIYDVKKRYLKVQDKEGIYIEINNDKNQLKFWRKEFVDTLRNHMLADFYSFDSDNEDLKMIIEIIDKMLEENND